MIKLFEHQRPNLIRCFFTTNVTAIMDLEQNATTTMPKLEQPDFTTDFRPIFSYIDVSSRV